MEWMNKSCLLGILQANRNQIMRFLLKLHPAARDLVGSVCTFAKGEKYLHLRETQMRISNMSASRCMRSRPALVRGTRLTEPRTPGSG